MKALRTIKDGRLTSKMQGQDISEKISFVSNLFNPFRSATRSVRSKVDHRGKDGQKPNL